MDVVSNAMRVFITLILSVFCVITVSGQGLDSFKLSLDSIKIGKDGLYESGKYYYNPRTSDIKQIIVKELPKVIPDFKFYDVFLEGYLGYHNISSRCLVLFDYKNEKFKIIPPLWSDDISAELIEMIVGHKFENSEELKTFIEELQEILLIGSRHNKFFRNNRFEENKITFDLYDSYKEERVWRKIEIGIENNCIKYLNSINPKTGKKLIIN